MPSFRYTLEPYNGAKSRYTCSQCNSKRKTFVRYIDTETGLHLASHVGRCGRQDSCGYHFTPKQFFKDDKIPLAKHKKSVDAFHLPSFIPATDWQNTLRHYEQNNFVQYLVKLFGYRKAGELAARYHVGTSKKWQGATIFWMLDEKGSCRTGKIMLYNRQTGKRVKEPYSHISWVHTLKDKAKRPLYPDFNLKQTLFGEHLLGDISKPICLVESEKTAIIASHFYPDRIWLATGGKEGLTKEKCSTIAQREVCLYPDAGSYHHWLSIAEKLFTNYSVSDVLEKEAQGMDIADVLVRMRG